MLGRRHAWSARAWHRRDPARQRSRGHRTERRGRHQLRGWFTCALTESAEVFCWGDNTARQLGSLVPVTSLSISTPTRIPEL
ncbi:MAG: hypothetical protein IPG81_27010 [Sandaracinaceae bacterium]|nr:hypothetical protein [Sandaracinaceae bacterium]